MSRPVQAVKSSMSNPKAWVVIGLTVAGIVILAETHRRRKKGRLRVKAIREDYGAFMEKFELLPHPQPPPPALKQPLTGLSFAIKDIFDVKGYQTGFGSSEWAKTHEASGKTAVVVTALLKNGAKCVGRTVMDELAFGMTGENSEYGTPVNPKMPSHIPGGSSSGSAVAVAAELVDFTLATDTTGCVRIPASFCGILGYRPSHGAVSTVGVLPNSPSLDTVGWFARDPSVLCRVGHILLQLKTVEPRRTRRILFADDLFQLSKVPMPKFVYIVSKAVEKLSGYQPPKHINFGQLIASSVPSLKGFQEQSTNRQNGISALKALSSSMLSLQRCEFKTNYEEWVDTIKPTLRPHTTDCVQKAINTSSENIKTLYKIRSEMRAALHDLLKEDGILVIPTVADPPLALNVKKRLCADFYDRALTLLSISSMSGCCQAVIPLGNHDGFPISISFIAFHGADKFLLDTVLDMYSSLQEQAGIVSNSVPLPDTNGNLIIDFSTIVLDCGWGSGGGDMEEDRAALVQSLIDTVNEIASMSGYRTTVKKQYCNLARRLKLLIPLFEEIKEIKEPLPEETIAALVYLRKALVSAKELLRFGCEGSKVYLVLERDQIMNKFHEVTEHLEKALSQISYEKLDIADEVKEQVELVLAQFRRSKERIDPPDVQLYEDLLSLHGKSHDAAANPAVLRRLAEKLELIKIGHLKQESIALHEMVSASGGDPGEIIEKMSMLLKKIKDFVLTENPDVDLPAGENNLLLLNDCGQESTEGNQKAPVIPLDYRCPISLELMKDPVIVSTGQTYDRSSIEQWLQAGHRTCPKTQQTLNNTVLTPNFVLRSLIDQWCETNGIEPPKPPSTSQSRPNKSTYASSSAESAKIESLLQKLTSPDPEVQQSAAGEIRLLAKRNAGNRVAIAEAGAIPLLVHLLSTPDSRTQEHTVTALLNLSICDDNKGAIVFSGAVPGIVHVLKNGSMEARENAAATLFSLSVIDEYKVTIGASGAIPPLVTLLSEGTQRGKKDAATALFNLCIYQGNKGKAVRARIIPTLMQLLTEPGGGMVDEALAVLAILAGHPDGRTAIGAAKAVPVLVEFIRSGSPRNRENAAAVLVHLFTGDRQHLLEAQEVGVMDAVLDLAQNGTNRGKRKAVQLLERLSQFMEQQQLQEQATGGQSEADIVSPNQESQVPSTTDNAVC